MKMTIWIMEDSTAPHMKAAMTIPATAPAPHQYNSCTVTYSYLTEMDNRVSTSWVTRSMILVWSGRVTGQCVRPVFDQVWSFNTCVYRSVVSSE